MALISIGKLFLGLPDQYLCDHFDTSRSLLASCSIAIRYSTFLTVKIIVLEARSMPTTPTTCRASQTSSRSGRSLDRVDYDSQWERRITLITLRSVIYLCSPDATSNNDDSYSASAQLAMQSAVLAMIDSVRLSVCLTVRLSRSGIMSKQLRLRSCGLHWRIAP